MDSKKNYQKFLGIFLGVMLVVGGGYWLWDGYLSSAAKARRFAENQVEQIEKAEKAYIAAMTADTYGGKTPKETLDLFVAALKKGDIDLASKYFLLDENLSRGDRPNALKEMAINESLDSTIDVTSKAIELKDSTIYDGTDAYFGSYSGGKLIADFILRLNQYSKVWKIESL